MLFSDINLDIKEGNAPAKYRVDRNRPLPFPKPLKFEYYWNRFLCFALSPRKLLNALKARAAKRGLEVDFLPLQLDIEPVSRCNLRCTMCQVSDWKKSKRAEDMTIEDYKQIIDSMYSLVEVKLQGLGEPLMARDKFFEMISYARKKHLWVRSTINATLLHLNDNYKKLIDSGINEVQISFDGASKETFEAIRRGANFERVKENCQLINAYAKEKGVLRTRMWIVVQNHNVHEFYDFVGLAKELGFERMTFSLNVHGWGIESWIEKNSQAEAEGNITDEDGFRAVELGRKMGVDVTFWRATHKYSSKSVDTLCQWPFERAYISSDMRVVPCCTIANPDVLELGDGKDFVNVWNSEQYKEFRAAHLKGEIPKACQMCYDQEKDK